MKFLVGERRAVAAAVLSFYGFLYLLNAVMAPPEMGPMFTAMAALYGVAFFGVVAGWFWGRWYAQGMGYFGLAMGVIAIWQLGLEPVLVFITVSHALISFLLAGEAMAASFDGRTDWRAKFHLDDGGVNRLGKSVVRAAMSLPLLLIWALAPTQPGDDGNLAALLPLALGGAGLWGLLRMRTWGLLALAGSAVTVAGVSLSGASLHGTAGFGAGVPVAIAAAFLLGGAVVPFARPLARKLVA